MLICGFGCAALGELVPQIVPVAKYIGAAYVLYLLTKRSFLEKLRDIWKKKSWKNKISIKKDVKISIRWYCKFFNNSYSRYPTHYIC